jgi:toxin ParE1/3/4
MNYEVVFSAKADKEIDDISDYISERNPSRSLTFIEELYQKAYSLSRMPFRFQAKGQNRRLVHGNYIMLYRVNESKKRVTILSIFEGHRA